MAKHVVSVIIQGVNNTKAAFAAVNASMTKMTGISKIMTAAIAGAMIYGAKKIVDMGAASVKAFAEFDYGIRRAAALSGEGEGAYDKLSAAAIKYGQATQFTGKQVGEAMTEMTMAGLTVDETMSSVSAVLDLAAASDIDLATATQFAVNTM